MVESIVNIITRKLVTDGIVAENDKEWFHYGLQKRFTSSISACVFFIIAVVLSNVCVACTYLGCFYFLRVRTNGYHAKTYIGCIISSIVIETFFLMAVLPKLNELWVFLLNGISFVIILIYAPVNSMNMHFDNDEILACKKSVQKRLALVATLLIFMCVLPFEDAAKGITLGNTMTMCLVVVAIIKKECTENEKSKPEHKICN